MEKIPDQPTPEEIEKIERSRADSTNKLHKEGADFAWDEDNQRYHEPLRTEITNEQLTEMQKKNEDGEYRRVMEMIDDNNIKVGGRCILRRKTGEVLKIKRIAAIGPSTIKIVIKLVPYPDSIGGTADFSYMINKPGDFEDSYPHRDSEIEYRATILTRRIYDKDLLNRDRIGEKGTVSYDNGRRYDKRFEKNKKLVEEALQKPRFLEIPFSDIEYITEYDSGKEAQEKLWYDRPKHKEENQS